MSAYNKLGQFSFKLLHRILVIKIETKKMQIEPDDEFIFCVQIPLNTHTQLSMLPRTFATK